MRNANGTVSSHALSFLLQIDSITPWIVVVFITTSELLALRWNEPSGSLTQKAARLGKYHSFQEKLCPHH